MLGLPISYNSSTLLHKAFGFGEISPLCIEFASLTVDLLGNHRVGNVNLQAKHHRSAAELHGNASHMLDPTQVTYFSLGGASSLSDRSCDVSLQAFISSHCMHCRTNTASMLFVIFGSKFQGLSRTTP